MTTEHAGLHPFWVWLDDELGRRAVLGLEPTTKAGLGRLGGFDSTALSRRDTPPTPPKIRQVARGLGMTGPESLKLFVLAEILEPGEVPTPKYVVADPDLLTDVEVWGQALRRRLVCPPGVMPTSEG